MEIIWCYTGPGSPGMRQFNRKHDTLFWYSKGDTWAFNKERIRTPHRDGAPHQGGFKMTEDERVAYGKLGKIPETWWTERKGNGLTIASRQKKQYVGYPTQKPLALYERIIRASSNEGDMVLDPFCGCATTLIAAERLKRQWVGIDIWEGAKGLVLTRLQREGVIRESDNLEKNQTEPIFKEEFTYIEGVPQRTR